jgi:hypothetical protein
VLTYYHEFVRYCSLVAALLMASSVSLSGQWAFNTTHGGDFELLAFYTEKTMGAERDYMTTVDQTDTLLMEVEARVSAVKRTKPATYWVEFSPKRLGAYGTFRESAPKTRLGYTVSAYGDLAFQWLKNKPYDDFSDADEKAWLILQQCMMPVPTQAINGPTSWSRKQVRQLFRRNFRKEVFLDFEFQTNGIPEKVAGVPCYKVSFVGTPDAQPVKTGPVEGAAWYDADSGHLMRLEVETGWLTYDFPGSGNGASFFYYKQGLKIQLQRKTKRKHSFLPPIEAEWKATWEQRDRLTEGHNWTVPLQYDEITALQDGKLFAGRIGQRFYLLNTQGQRLSLTPFEAIVDAKRHGAAAVRTTEGWQLFGPSGKPLGGPYASVTTQVTEGGYWAHEAGYQKWQIRNLEGQLAETLEADAVFSNQYGFSFQLNGQYGYYLPGRGILLPPKYKSIKESPGGVQEASQLIFYARTADSISYYTAKGYLHSVPDGNPGRINYPLAEVNYHSSRRPQLFDLERRQALGQTSYDHMVSFRPDYYVSLQEGSDVKHLIRVADLDTLHSSSLIMIRDRGHRAPESKPHFVVGLKGKDQPDRACLLSENGDTIVQEPFVNFKCLENGYILAFRGASGKSIVYDSTGRRVFYEPVYSNELFWLDPHRFYFDQKIYNCQSGLAAPVPGYLNVKRIFSDPRKPGYGLLSLEQNGKRWLATADFSPVTPAIADEIKAVYPGGALVKIDQKWGVLSFPETEEP